MNNKDNNLIFEAYKEGVVRESFGRFGVPKGPFGSSIRPSHLPASSETEWRANKDGGLDRHPLSSQINKGVDRRPKWRANKGGGLDREENNEDGFPKPGSGRREGAVKPHEDGYQWWWRSPEGKRLKDGDIDDDSRADGSKDNPFEPVTWGDMRKMNIILQDYATEVGRPMYFKHNFRLFMVEPTPDGEDNRVRREPKLVEGPVYGGT